MFQKNVWNKRAHHPQIPSMLLTENERDAKKGKEFLSSFLVVHESLPSHLSTPRRYLALLHTYRTIHNTKKEGVIQRQRHLKVRFILLAIS